MGSFFSNVQVHTGPDDAVRLREKVIEALRAWARSEGYEETESAEGADRIVLGGPATSQPWIAVYDQATETQDPVRLQKLGETLSRAVETFVVTTLVHDGDLLDLHLLRQAGEIDEFSSWPGYFEGEAKPTSGGGRDRRGHPERWRSLLVEGATEKALRDAWETSAALEEASEILRRMAPLIGWDPGQVTVGFDTIPDSLRSACVQLHFRSRSDQAAALPALAYEGGSPKLQARVGETVQLSAVAHNTGGASRGLSIALWGEALDQGLVEPAAEGTLQVGALAAGRESGTGFDLVKKDEVLAVTLAEFPIPKGVSEPSAAFARAGSTEQGLSLWLASRIEVTVQARALRAGKAELHIGLVPMSNPEEGQTSWTIRLEIQPDGDQ